MLSKGPVKLANKPPHRNFPQDSPKRRNPHKGLAPIKNSGVNET
jgi:hypothetical protein